APPRDEAHAPPAGGAPPGPSPEFGAFQGGGAGSVIRSLLEPGPAEWAELRAHYLWINLASLGIVVVFTVFAFAMIVRWPVRGLLMAIEDIEHGGVPAAGGMTAPSELRQIGAALHRLARQLRGSTQERELMLAGMSHDLRSPLARIQAAIELRARPDEDWTPVLRDIREIDHIVGQCIDFVRDGQDESTSALSIDELVRSALRSPDDDEVELDLAAPQILHLRRQSMTRALRNLLNNAEVHGASPLKVTTRGDRESVTLIVEDHGKGIAAGQWELLLKPFAQGSRARNPSGAGLGLAIVQRIVAQHNGSLRMREASHGVPFAITLSFPTG
ncbi:MAG: ATP-binding protein, partial [Solimonas sp.]